MKSINKIKGLGLIVTFSLFCSTAFAQYTLHDDGEWHTFPCIGTYKDYLMPSSTTYSYIEFKVVGADGGTAQSGNCNQVVGGAGAIVTAVLEIGNSNQQIPLGATLRFIAGEGGNEVEYTGGGAGGGGGSAVLLQVSGQSDPYRILAVAGGGGGAYANGNGLVCRHDPGNSAQTGSSGGTADGDGKERGTPGSNGQGALQSTQYLNYGGGGGGAFSSAHLSNNQSMDFSGKAGGWTGGHGGWQAVTLNGENWNSLIVRGGFGFGGGGGGCKDDDDEYDTFGAGGGGGYSGGANGFSTVTWTGIVGSAGGGGSYLLPGIYYGNIIVGNRTKATNNGYIDYRFIKFRTIHLLADQTKCLDDYGAGTANGTNIQLWGCNNRLSQSWDFEGLNIRLGKAENKCIDLNNSNTTNANNIQLFDCNNTDAQHWVYDGVNKLIRSKINLNKCIHVQNNLTNPGTNIYINDCSPGSTAQVWLVDYAATKPSDTKVVTIRPDYAQNKCMDLSGGNTTNGTNIQLWTCGGTDGKDGNENQQWYFDGLQIKLYKNPSKCLDLSNSNTSNGANIQLYDCNYTNAQHWAYNGITHEFRSGVDLNKCIYVLHGNTTNGTNFQLNDCESWPGMHFTISAVPCIEDTTPPVAKCKDVTYTMLTAPAASDVDDGSYDNCSVKSMYLESANNSINLWKLTVVDTSGNSSSCTATVSYQ